MLKTLKTIEQGSGESWGFFNLNLCCFLFFGGLWGRGGGMFACLFFIVCVSCNVFNLRSFCYEAVGIV